MSKGTLSQIVGDATRPANEGAQPIVIPHIVNDICRWRTGFVKAITDRWGPGPQLAYEWWYNLHQYNNRSEDDTETKYPKDPMLDLHNAGWHHESPFVLGGCQTIKLPNNIYIANMLAQRSIMIEPEDDRPPIRYGALVGSMQLVLAAVHDIQHKTGTIPEIHCPMFGSDRAGGNWEVILQMIREIWVDNGWNVVVYKHGQSPDV